MSHHYLNGDNISGAEVKLNLLGGDKNYFSLPSTICTIHNYLPKQVRCLCYLPLC